MAKDIKVLMNPDGSLFKTKRSYSADNARYAINFVLADDEVPEGFVSKQMSFGEFNKLAKEETGFIFYYYDEGHLWGYWATDAYPSFTKNFLDEIFEESDESEKKRLKELYYYLF